MPPRSPPLSRPPPEDQQGSGIRAAERAGADLMNGFFVAGYVSAYVRRRSDYEKARWLREGARSHPFLFLSALSVALW